MEHSLKRIPKHVYSILDKLLDRVLVKRLSSDLSVADAAILLSAKESPSVNAIAAAADACRAVAPCKDNVSYVVNRNINFTNACIMRCGFCAFSRTGIDEEAYFLPLEEIVRRAAEAANLGATEICIQAGLPPNMDKNLYVTVAKSVKDVLPGIHLHAFSPEEIIYGAKRNKISVLEMISRLKDAGVNSFPGTSAEILNDTVRENIAKGRLSSKQWKEVVQAAHSLHIPTTATMMYGHIETAFDVADHIAQIREIQTRSKNEYDVGFTEFVPLSFVAKESPMWKNQNDLLSQRDALQQIDTHSSEAVDSIKDLGVGATQSPHTTAPFIRSGPTGVEVILTHAVSRLMLAGHIDNIQVSWPKEGYRMSQVLLGCGVNDLGGTLMNESISTAAGAAHGQFASPNLLRSLITSANRIPVQRSTDYTVRRTFPESSGEEGSALDDISDSLGVFGSFEKLTKSKDNRYLDFHRNKSRKAAAAADNVTAKRFFSTSLQRSSSASFVAPSSSFSSLSYDGHVSLAHLSDATNTKLDNNNDNDMCSMKVTAEDSRIVTYSSSYTIVPTYECFNLCTYCNFRQNVRSDDSLMMSLATVNETLTALKKQNADSPLSAVHEILILSGEVHPRSLRRSSWFARILEIASLCLDHGFLPHTNIGPLSLEEMRMMGEVNSSMGLMLEQSAPLDVHRLAPSKVPALRLEQLTQAGDLGIPFTTGILLGIGETFEDRVRTIEDIASVARRYGNIQEVIIQPYSPGAKDKYSCVGGAVGFPLRDLPLFVAQARAMLPDDVRIQVPPNLVSPDEADRNQRNSQELKNIRKLSSASDGSIKCKQKESLSSSSYSTLHSDMTDNNENKDKDKENKDSFLLSLITAGARDLGGISPVDEVNPTYHFQKINDLKAQLQCGDFELVERLPVYERHYSLLSERVRNVVNKNYSNFYA